MGLGSCLPLRPVRGRNREPSSSSCPCHIPQRKKLPPALSACAWSRPRERVRLVRLHSRLMQLPLPNRPTCVQCQPGVCLPTSPRPSQTPSHRLSWIRFPGFFAGSPLSEFADASAASAFPFGLRFRCQLPAVPATAASRCCSPRLPLAAFTLPKGDNAGAHPNFASPRRAGMRT